MQHVLIRRTWNNGDQTEHHFAALDGADEWLEVSRAPTAADEADFRAHITGEAPGFMPMRFHTRYLRRMAEADLGELVEGSFPPAEGEA